MQLSLEGLALLKDLEGSSMLPYTDVAGLLTIGVGHLLTKDELTSGKILIHSLGRIKYHGGLTTYQTDLLLRQDLLPVEMEVHTALREGVMCQPAQQHHYDSLCCFVFNIGLRAFTGSTLYKKLTSGHAEAVPVQMRRWVYAGGRIIEGLKRRREREIALWLKITT